MQICGSAIQKGQGASVFTLSRCGMIPSGWVVATSGQRGRQVFQSFHGFFHKIGALLSSRSAIHVQPIGAWIDLECWPGKIMHQVAA